MSQQSSGAGTQPQAQPRPTRQHDNRRPTADKLKQNAKNSYPSAKHAKEYLAKAGYLSKDVPVTLTQLCGALFLLAHSASNKALAEAIKSTALLIEEEMPNPLIDKITPMLERMGKATKDVSDAAERIFNNTNRQYSTFKEERDEIQKTTSLLQSAVETAAESLQKENQNGNRNQPNPTFSYAAAVTGNLPPTHHSMLIRSQTRSRQVLIDTDPEAENNMLVSLTETELVAKANEAIRSMEEVVGHAAQEFTAMGARHLKNGGVIYKFNSPEAANFIRDERDTFLLHFGGTAVVKDRSLSIIAEYVPLAHSPDALGEFQKIERNSGMEAGDIITTHWIKPVTKRKEGQKSAHLIIKVASTRCANFAIQNGLIIAGKRVRARRMNKEPCRCLKCQKLGVNHIAVECKDKETCGTCGKEHRTSTCTETDPSKFRCKNCGDNVQHASWDRMCPKFISECKRLEAQDNERSYKFFPTGETWTWEQRGDTGFTGTGYTQGQAQQTRFRAEGWRDSWTDEVERERCGHLNPYRSRPTSRLSQNANPQVGRSDAGWDAISRANQPNTPSQYRQTMLNEFNRRENEGNDRTNTTW